MDAGVIIAVVTGGFGLSSLIIQRLFDIKCAKNENEDGSIKSVHCVPRCRNCIYPIPDQKIENVLSDYREPPDNWVFKKTSRYTKQIGETDKYLIIVPKKLKNDNGDCVWQGNVVWFKEFTKKSDTKTWFFEADLDCIKNTKSVKIFIKRFYLKNGKPHLLENNCEFIGAINGRNSFEADSLIGEILTEKEIRYNDEGNAIKEKKTYLCTHEQIGLVIYSKTDNDVVTPEIGFCKDTKNEDLLNEKIKKFADECDFYDDIVKKIWSRDTSTCKINAVYVSDVSLYVFDNRNILN